MRSAKHIITCVLLLTASILAADTQPHPEFLQTSGEVGRFGGKLVVSQRAEPKTFNPVTASDSPSREVIRRITADLIHINRQTYQTEPALAKSWTASPDGMRYVVHLRHGVRFSDGAPFNADDVMFSFQVYLDEKVASPQRDLLLIGGKPITATKIDDYTVSFRFPQPYAAGDRVFDSLAILPKHLLEAAYRSGGMAQQWTLNTPPEKIAGLGPFRLKKYVPGQAVVLERNPYYWKCDRQGHALPYLDELSFVVVPNDDAQVLRFQSGATDIANRISADNFASLKKEEAKSDFQLFDAGPSLEYNFLMFNLNDGVEKAPQVAKHQSWFRDVRFRQAISAAVDRDAIVKLVYQGRGAGIVSQVTPGNKRWLDPKVGVPKRDVARAKDMLREAGFTWSGNQLRDPGGSPVAFSIIAPSNNSARVQMATLIQNDLKDLGIDAAVVPLEFRSLLDRVTNTHDYDAAIMGFGSGDVDPTAEMNVWMSSGSTHLWHQGEKPSTGWQAEIDRLMQAQMVTLDYRKRKQQYDRVQELVAENLPIIPLASPDILVGAKKSIGNFKPAILDHYTLSNVEELFWRGTQ